MPENGTSQGDRLPVARSDQIVQFASIGSGAIALAGVSGYWIAGALQCGLQSRWVQPVACPLSSTPILAFLSLLTLTAILFAIVSVRGGMGRLDSVASSILIAGAICFPAGYVFPWMAVPSGIPDPRVLAGAFVVMGGLVGLLVSVWRRRPDPARNGPYNRLALGTALIAFAGLEANWFPGEFLWQASSPYQGYPGPPGGLVGMRIFVSPLPESGVIVLMVAALAVATPIFARSLMGVSFGCAFGVFLAALYYSSGLGISIIWIELGAMIAIWGSLPGVWTVYVAPRQGPFWPRVHRSEN